MTIDTDTMVSMSEANQNFSRVARIVDEHGSAIVMKNNKPRYVILDFAQVREAQPVDDDELLVASRAYLQKRGREAFAALRAQAAANGLGALTDEDIEREIDAVREERLRRQ